MRTRWFMFLVSCVLAAMIIAPLAAIAQEDNKSSFYMSEDGEFSAWLPEGWAAEYDPSLGLGIGTSQEFLTARRRPASGEFGMIVIPLFENALGAAILPDTSLNDLLVAEFTAAGLHSDEMPEIVPIELGVGDYARPAAMTHEFSDEGANWVFVTLRLLPNLYGTVLMSANEGEMDDFREIGLAILETVRFSYPLLSRGMHPAFEFGIPADWVVSTEHDRVWYGNELLYGDAMLTESLPPGRAALTLIDLERAETSVDWSGLSLSDAARWVFEWLEEDDITEPTFVTSNEEEFAYVDLGGHGGFAITKKNERPYVVIYAGAPGEGRLLFLTALNILRELEPVAETVFTDDLRAMYLEQGGLRVGVDKFWGGAIREITFNTHDLVNNHDGGRLLAVSFYDGDAPTGFDPGAPEWGWNPTPSDEYNHTNEPITYSFTDGVLYIQTRYLQWNPDDKGGGPERAATSDVVVETWMDIVKTEPGVIHLRYRVTHEGDDSHALAQQELPFVYVRAQFNRFVSYTGAAPWTGDSAAIEVPPVFPDVGNTASTEHWAGFVNADDVGLVLWSPQAYPNFAYNFHNNPGRENATHYLIPLSFLTFEPGVTYDYEVYLFAGRWQDARAFIYGLASEHDYSDIMSSFGWADTQSGTISGILDVGGWALDNRGVAKIEVFLDGEVVGQAQHGLTREDVVRDYPGVPGALHSGFLYRLDTRLYANGSHTLEIRATDTAGIVSLLRPGKMTINVSNSSSG